MKKIIKKLKDEFTRIDPQKKIKKHKKLKKLQAYKRIRKRDYFEHLTEEE